MKNSICRYFILFACLVLWQIPVYAARTFTAVQTSPSPAEFDMGTVSAGTFRIANTSTGANSTENITSVRFRLNTGTTFSSATAPAGWTIATLSGTTLTLTANTFANGIPSGSFVDFPIVFNIRSTSADTTERFRDVRATFTTTGGATSNVTGNIPAPGWTLKSLVVVLTPSATSVPRSCAFTLTMQVTNKSTSNITNVTSVPKPPTITTTGGTNATTPSNPANFNLSAGANNSFVWTYNTNNTAGTITFTASASDGAGHTSRTITSAVITVTTSSCFTATFTLPPAGGACIYSGDTATFTVHVVNNTGGTLTNVQPSVPTKGGTATIGTLSPATQTAATLANGGTVDFTWTAPITGNVDDTYFISTTVTSTGGSNPSASAKSDTTADIKGYLVQPQPLPNVNASSNNQEITLSVANHACNNVSSILVATPAGWTWNGDSYSLVNGIDSGASAWTVTPSGLNALFTAPGGNQLTVGATAELRLTYTIPSTTGTATFNLTVTDNTSLSKPASDSVNVNTFNSGSPNPNATNTGTWREQF